MKAVVYYVYLRRAPNGRMSGEDLQRIAKGAEVPMLNVHGGCDARAGVVAN